MTRHIINLVVGALLLGFAGFTALFALIEPGPYDWVNAPIFVFDIFAGGLNLRIYFTKPEDIERKKASEK